MTTKKMYDCAGWQNVREHSERGIDFPIRTADYPLEHAQAALDFTHARNESLAELLADLKKAAGVSSLPYTLHDGE